MVCREKLKDDSIAWLRERCVWIVAEAIATDGDRIEGGRA